MDKLIQDVGAEVADNWPAFAYILLMVVFSIRFLSERRAETRMLKKQSEELHATIQSRFDRLERMVSNPRSRIAEESVTDLTDQLVAIRRRS